MPTKEKQTGIDYLDPLPKLTSNKEELQAFRYCVIDGNCYAMQLEPAVLPDGRAGYLFKNVCAGPVEKVKQKIQDRENGVVTPSPDRRQRHPSGVEEVGHNSSEGKTTILVENEGGIMSQKRGPKHKELPQGLIKRMAKKEKSSRVIAQRLEDEKGIKVSYKTIQRILKGQRVLV